MQYCKHSITLSFIGNRADAEVCITECGVWIKGGDGVSMADTVIALHQDSERLKGG